MICLTGGKTGGHIIPLLALAKKIDKVCYIGAKNSLEERLCKKNQITFIAMDLKNNHIIGVLNYFYRRICELSCPFIWNFASHPHLPFGGKCNHG